MMLFKTSPAAYRPGCVREDDDYIYHTDATGIDIQIPKSLQTLKYIKKHRKLVLRYKIDLEEMLAEFGEEHLDELIRVAEATKENGGN